MDKYRKVVKERAEKGVQDEDEIRLTAMGSVSAYVSRAAKVYGELGKSKVESLPGGCSVESQTG